MYIPEYLGARTARQYDLGGQYRFELKTDLLQSPRSISAGIAYEHILEISRIGEVFPFAYITSELVKPPEDPLDDFFAELEPEDVEGTHYLCCFHGEKRVNHGASDAWADLDNFEQGALELAEEMKLAPVTKDLRRWRTCVAAEDKISQMLRKTDAVGRERENIRVKFPKTRSRLSEWACRKPQIELGSDTRH